MKDLAQKVVEAIIEDLEDRQVVKQEWAAIDSAVRRGIERAWVKLVRKELTKHHEKQQRASSDRT